jgi:hypothetical protein
MPFKEWFDCVDNLLFPLIRDDLPKYDWLAAYVRHCTPEIAIYEAMSADEYWRLR